MMTSPDSARSSAKTTVEIEMKRANSEATVPEEAHGALVLAMLRQAEGEAAEVGCEESMKRSQEGEEARKPQFDIARIVRENLLALAAKIKRIMAMDPKRILEMSALYEKFKGNLQNLPQNLLDGLDFSVGNGIFTCPESGFQLSHYIDKQDSPVTTPGKIKNLKRVHSELLMPIVEHYRPYLEEEGLIVPGSCILTVVFGLASPDLADGPLGGSLASQHIDGTAVDFAITGLGRNKIIDDIVNGEIDVDFGVIAAANGVHISLPFEFEGETVRGLHLKTRDGGSEKITYQFV